jgi:hypothetical protein
MERRYAEKFPPLLGSEKKYLMPSLPKIGKALPFSVRIHRYALPFLFSVGASKSLAAELKPEIPRETMVDFDEGRSSRRRNSSGAYTKRLLERLRNAPRG